MELLFGLGIIAALVAWGVAGWWRYWRAVQAAAEAQPIAKAQIESLQRQIYACSVIDKHRRETETIDWEAERRKMVQARRDAWAGRVLDEVLRGMEGRTE